MKKRSNYRSAVSFVNYMRMYLDSWKETSNKNNKELQETIDEVQEFLENEVTKVRKLRDEEEGCRFDREKENG